MLTSYIHTLQKETERDVRKIESSEAEIISRALAVSLLLEKVFDKLKRFISTYEFQSEADEIEFFKEIKPRIFCKLIYYRKIYNIEMNRPVSGPDSVKAYLNRELDNIQDYNHKRLDFYRYYRSGASYLDNVYFCEMSLIILSSISIVFILNGILCFRHVEISESPRFSPVTC